jgi:hypothetical protein
VGATSFVYAAPGDDEIKVDIFDMAGARGAFGVFAHGRESSFHHPALQNDYVTIARDNPLGIGYDKDALI